MNIQKKDIELTQNQKKAVETIEGLVLIIAGPGTGKTTTLIERTINLISNHKVLPKEILIATFTEKAAHKLQSELSKKLLNDKFNLNEMYLGTFHAICQKLLNKYNQNDFILLDEFEQKYFIYRHYEDFEKIPNFKDFFKTTNNWKWKNCEDIAKIINNLEDFLIKSEDINDNDYTFFGKLTQIYRELRKKNHFVDFSSLQTKTYNFFKENSEQLKELQDQIKYVMIDEYQDTNYIQKELIRLFGGHKQNICVVGDDDQSIYRFRGATWQNFLTFEEDFNKDKKYQYTKINLNENFRSNQKIINFCNQWIAQVKHRYEKNIKSIPEEKNNETVFACHESQLDVLIKNLQNEKKITDYNQIAFLSSSVDSKKKYIEKLFKKLEEEKIPYFAPRSNKFFEREEIKLLIGSLISIYISNISNIRNESKKKNKIDKLKKYKYYTYYENLKKNNNFYLEELSKLKYNRYNRELLYKIIKYKPFNNFFIIKDINKSLFHPENTRKIRNIVKFIDLLTQFEKIEKRPITNKNIFSFFKYLTLRQNEKINEYEDEIEYAPSECVSFLTIHQAKGLEFPIVIVDVRNKENKNKINEINENINKIIEKYRDFEKYEENWEENDFRRKYYVAFSRAKSLLILLGNDDSTSPIISDFNEIPNIDEINYQKFNFKEIKNNELQKKYSFSELETFKTCPAKYKFANIFGFKANNIKQLHGKLIHETFNQIHKNIIENANYLITETNIIIEKIYENVINELDLYDSKETKRIKEQAKQEIENYVNYLKKNKNISSSNISDSEKQIDVKIDGEWLTGCIDLITKENENNINIFDFKTSKKIEENHKEQLLFYAYLYKEKTGKKITNIYVYQTNNKQENPIQNYSCSDEEMKKTFNNYKEIIQKIKNEKQFKPNANKKNCDECDYYFCRQRIKK